MNPPLSWKLPKGKPVVSFYFQQQHRGFQSNNSGNRWIFFCEKDTTVAKRINAFYTLGSDFPFDLEKEEEHGWPHDYVIMSNYLLVYKSRACWEQASAGWAL